MGKKILRQNIDAYLLSGFGVPEGLLEDWTELTGRDYKPSGMVAKVYWILTGQRYE